MTAHPKDIHCIAIGGTGMAPLACLLKKLGHTVRGSDGPLYPPMSDLLASVGIEPLVGFDPAHLEPRPDLVVVGNAVPRHNPEAEATESLGIERISMPQALGRWILAGRQPIVAAGTHGKTTTTAMTAFLLDRLGHEPGYLIGGAPIDLAASFELGEGEPFVIEGDEYNAAYFDRGAKFLHYKPDTLVITSLEYDHADLYPTREAFLEAFDKLVADLESRSGLLIACGESKRVRDLGARARTRGRCRGVLLYGTIDDDGSEGDDASEGGASERALDLWAGGITTSSAGSSFRVSWSADESLDRRAGSVDVRMPIWGRHNVSNALAAFGVALSMGAEPESIARALGSFRGVQRRLQLLAETGGVAIVDDFAHHPTEVAGGIEGLRQRFGDRRLIVAFEPRSLTAARAEFLEPYVTALSGADAVVLAPVFHASRLEDDERLDTDQLVELLDERGVDAVACQRSEEVLPRVLERVRSGSVVVTMSSGSFDGLPRLIVESVSSSSTPSAD